MVPAASLPFPVGEYRERARRVRAELERRGIDVLYVTSPANMCYLTGFESIWYPPRAPLGVVVARESEQLVFVDYERHRTLVEETAQCDDAIFFTYETALDTIAGEFARRGWTAGTVGLERHSKFPAAPLLDAVGAKLAERGARIVPGDWAVDRVRLVKSSAELERVRRASAIVDAAFLALPEIVRPGLTELQIASRLNAVMADHGGEEAAIRTMVSAGPLVWCKTHAAPSRRPVEAGDVMYVDACGVYDRYHVDLCRTFAIGRDNPTARAILDVTAGSVEAVRDAVRPGDPLDAAQRVAEEYVFSRFPRERVWWVGGYALGVALPPDWVGHTYLSNDAHERFTWEPGYVTNYENILFDPDERITASYMETLLMTEDGIEILSRVPRGLTVLG
ncbi:MAG: aminopeptidase P family protein [Thermoleophilia bacterium]|nr:aminopeptidase P family protein [Thermoleophilia bacterium]